MLCSLFSQIFKVSNTLPLVVQYPFRGVQKDLLVASVQNSSIEVKGSFRPELRRDHRGSDLLRSLIQLQLRVCFSRSLLNNIRKELYYYNVLNSTDGADSALIKLIKESQRRKEVIYSDSKLIVLLQQPTNKLKNYSLGYRYFLVQLKADGSQRCQSKCNASSLSCSALKLEATSKLIDKN